MPTSHRKTRTRQTVRATPLAKKPTPSPAGPPALPISLEVMATILREDATELRRALTAARLALKEFVEDTGPGDFSMEAYIRDYAEVRGPFHDQVARAIALDPGNIEGDLVNAYAAPGILFGMSLAWLMLGGTDGAR
jgi:hypothetical protein